MKLLIIKDIGLLGQKRNTIKDNQTKQLEEVKKQNLENACLLECAFIRALAYVKYCGIHLDQSLWLDKMEKDKHELEEALKALFKRKITKN